MSNTAAEDLVTHKSEILQVKDQDVVSISMPCKHYFQECSLSRKRFVLYKTTLLAGGMDFSQVDKLETLIGAGHEIYSRVSQVQFPNLESQKAWNAAKEEGEELLYDLLSAMDFAFNDFPELLQQVSAIRDGNSNPDFIQDLNDASVLCKDHADLLTAVKYDISNGEKAAVLSKTLQDLYAQATLDRSVIPEERILRDKGFSLLKKTVDFLNKQARYIFRSNKLVAGSFMIKPPAKRSSKKAIPSGEVNQTPQPAIA